MTLHVHRGSRLEQLVEELGDVLADPLPDPFTAEVVSVPTAGVRDWTIRQLAGRLGIAANVEMPFPGRLLTRALGRQPDRDDPWDVERLVWTVMAVADECPGLVPGWVRPDLADIAPPAVGRYVLARRIADLFDHYATNRPTLVQQWANGAVSDGTLADDGRTVGSLAARMRWQYDLWREVRRTLGRPTLAEQLPDLLAHLRSGELSPELPDRLGLFGVSSLSTAQMDVLDAVASRRDVHVFVVHPSPVAWSRVRPAPPGALVARTRDGRSSNPEGIVGHPLLRSWGRLTFETAAIARGHDGADHGDAMTAGEDRPASTLLDHVQADIVADRPPRRFGGPPDGSLQVHTCHGVVRQLEVLRDVLDHVFVENPELPARDVVVLCPDPERFAPFARAVFDSGTLPVPLTVSDRSLGGENPVASAFLAVLRVLAGRCGVGDVLDVAALEPVRRHLRISVDDLSRFARWGDALGTTWGLDESQRAEQMPGLERPITDGTWQSTTDSLLVGAMMSSPVPRAVGDVVPFDDMSSDGVECAGRLADLLARLRYARELAAVRRDVPQWCDVLVELLALFCRADPIGPAQMADVTGVIEELRRCADVHPVEIDLGDLIAIVEGMGAERAGRLALRTGAVLLTGLVPLRNVPAEVVCLLGFDEASLRSASVDGDDVLGVRPLIGERDRRGEHRHLLLEAVLAARRHLVITCDGADLTTNRLIRSPVQLAELLDVVDVSLGIDPATDDEVSPVLTRHPRRSYDPGNFRPEAPFGFDDVMRNAAEAPRRTSFAPFIEPLAVNVPSLVTIAQLTESCTRPARTLLRDRIDARLPGELSSFDEHIPLDLTPLRSTDLGRRLLERVRCGTADLDVTVAEWKESERHLGTLPPRRLADESLDTVATETRRLLDGVGAAVRGLDPLHLLRATRTVPLAVGVSDPSWVAAAETLPRLDDIVEGVLDDAGDGPSATVGIVLYERLKPRHIVRAALTIGALVMADPLTAWTLVLAARNPRSAAKPVARAIRAVGSDPGTDAARLLDVAFECRLRALRSRLALFETASPELARSGRFDSELLWGDGFTRGDLDDPHTGFVWAGAEIDDILAADPTPHELADSLWGAMRALIGDQP